MHSRAFSISVLSAQSINKTIEVLARLKALAKGPLAVLTSNRDKIVKSIQGLGSGGLLTLLWTNQETVMEKVIESIPFQWVKKVLKILVKLYKPAIIYGGVISSFALGVGWYTYKYGGWEQLWGMQISEELNGPILMIIADDALESNISRKEVLKLISQNGFTAVIPLCGKFCHQFGLSVVLLQLSIYFAFVYLFFLYSEKWARDTTIKRLLHPILYTNGLFNSMQ